MQAHKIDSDDLTRFEINEDISTFFGNWYSSSTISSKDFSHATPYPHVVIDNFLSPTVLNRVISDYPRVDNSWHVYNNPIEVKFSLDDLNKMPDSIQKVFYALYTREFIAKLCELTGINDLEIDPHLVGAGLHAHPRHGRLHVHLDYENHPIMVDKERRLNIILYLSPNWKQEYNGATELWDAEVTHCSKKISVEMNRALIFRTNDVSYHGLPDHVLCPAHIKRQSLAIYYMSPLTTNKKEYRMKASYVKRPSDPENPRMETLYKIRPHRRITSDDMSRIWPEWSMEQM